MVIQIIVIISLILFFSFLIGNHIYRKKHHLPTGECQYCHSSTSGKKLYKAYKKKYKCDCGCSK